MANKRVVKIEANDKNYTLRFNTAMIMDFEDETGTGYFNELEKPTFSTYAKLFHFAYKHGTNMKIKREQSLDIFDEILDDIGFENFVEQFHKGIEVSVGKMPSLNKK